MKNLCEICKKRKATHEVVQFINGEKKVVSICDKCVLIVGMQDQLTTLEKSSKIEKLVCPVCGWQLANLAESGLVGCPTCYDTFSEFLKILIFKPVKSPKFKQIKFEKKQLPMAKLATLRLQLRKAIEEERFEDAAEIRDKIKDIEDMLTSKQGDL